MKKSVLKTIGILAIIGVLVGGIVGYRIWNAPQRDVRDEKGIVVTAQGIIDAYAANEKNADSLYLDKAIEVSGTVAELSKNQQGKLVISLKTSDPMAGVRCTMKEETAIKAGDNVKIKGKCTGLNFDVILIDCYIEK